MGVALFESRHSAFYYRKSLPSIGIGSTAGIFYVFLGKLFAVDQKLAGIDGIVLRDGVVSAGDDSDTDVLTGGVGHIKEAGHLALIAAPGIGRGLSAALEGRAVDGIPAGSGNALPGDSVIADKDLGASGRDENDYFGYAGHSRSICYFYQGMDGKTTGRDENGAVTPVISDDKVDAIYTKLYDFYNQSWAWHNLSLDAGVHSSSHKMFYDGNALFIYWITATLDYTEIDMFERGRALLPKYDLDQEFYRCPAGGGAYFFPSNIEDIDAMGYILESLCEASYRIVYPADIQEAINFQELTDEGSIEVTKLADQSGVYDILKSCDPSLGLLASCGYIWYCISNNTTPSAAASSVKSVVERQFSEFFYGKE